MEATASYITDLLGQELRALCGTCNHHDSCTYRQQAKKVIIQCEMFSGAETVASPVLTETEPLAGRVAQGLCDTCIHQRSCSFFKRSGYVWHCEEFA
ncbi:MAG TPA: hypothetical protein VFM90_05065 [Cyclobacteriaceae bacterium]|nr:hypothetical protein [Cyclobacteriaceae bacterium]